MEITVISAEGLKNKSSIFSQHLRPFITLTTVPWEPRNLDRKFHVYDTRVDEQGGANPIWNDKFHVPLDSTFFTNKYSYIFIQLYTKRSISGPSQLGWCQIPVNDILNELSPAGLTRRLSYRLKDRDGSRGHGVVHIAVKVEGFLSVRNVCQSVMGIPLSSLPSTALLSQSSHPTSSVEVETAESVSNGIENSTL